MIRWAKSTVATRAAGLRADPYYEWARATKFAYYGEGAWLPVLIELVGNSKPRGTALAFAELVFTMQQRAAHEQEWAAHLRVPASYARLLQRMQTPTRFLAVLARKQFLDAVYVGNAPAESIRRFEIGRLVRPSSASKLRPSAFRPINFVNPPPAVITGVIDDGIAFAHDRFLSADGTTRIEYVWDQLTPSDEWDDWGYGSEISKRDPDAGIDKLMADSQPGSLVDEDEVYRRSGFVDPTRAGHQPLALRLAHGTHVLDLACGSNAHPAARTRPVVAVQLPTETVEDTSGASLAPQVYQGLRYVLDKAEAIASIFCTAQLPVVVNISYGTIAGPHDGSSLLEQAMDELIDDCDPALRIVLPAGNNHLSRCHACFSLAAAPSTPQVLLWRVLPDDRTESHLEIWFPADAGALAITITTPDGAAANLVNWSDAQDLYDGADVVGNASYYPPDGASDRALVRLSLAPTDDPAGEKPLAPAGLWRVEVKNTQSTAAVNDIHAWIQRDDTPPGYKRRGRQSYFDDPDYERYDDGGRPIVVDNGTSYVKRDGTLNAIATGRETIVIGGFRRSDGVPAPYSASGPVVPPARHNPSPDGPDAMLPSDDSPSHRGLLAAGTRSSSCAAMDGTSVAAPQAARLVADMMAASPLNDRAAVFNAAVAKEAASTDTPAQKRGGGGRIQQISDRPPRWPPS